MKAALFYTAFLLCTQMVCAQSSNLVGGAALNGNFNLPGTAGNVTFADEPYWENMGSGNQTATFLADTPANSLDGTHYAQLSEKWGMIPGLDTGYTIVDGNIFNISYQWHDGWNWDDGTDQVMVRLFVTHNNQINGTPTTLVSALSGTSTANSAYELVSHNGIYTASAADVGKKLFVAIEVQGGATLDSYGQVDNFELSLNVDGDSDSDGLPDAWELAQFGSLTASDGGDDNYDGDPSTDLEECAAGTSATNPASFFQTPLTMTGSGAFDVSIDGVSNRTYVLEVSETLSPSNRWIYAESIGPILSNRTVVLSGGASGDPAALFGRVKVSPDPLDTPSARYAPAGYTFVWGDHFGNNALDPDKWFVGMRDPVSGDLIPGAHGDFLLNTKYAGYVTAEDSYVEEGSLILLNQKRTYSGSSPAGTYQYTSGWVSSMHRGHLNKGYIEVRAKFPSGDKVWPAIWLIAEDLVWGPEWDLWEYFGYRSDVGYDNMGMHLMTGPWDNTKWNATWIKPFDTLYDSEAWHIYGWEWTDTYARWWIDGNVVHTLYRSATKDPAAWPDEEMYIVLNNGVRTASPDTTATWPNRLQIDYIEVYQIP